MKTAVLSLSVHFVLCCCENIEHCMKYKDGDEFVIEILNSTFWVTIWFPEIADE